MEKGIYIIRNIINDKIYIGSALNFRKRFNIHKSQLIKNKHHSIKLQRAWNKYGADNFEFEIIEYVEDKNKLIEREQVWIDFFKPEYNICKVAGSRIGTTQVAWNKGKKLSDSHKKNLSIAKLNGISGNTHWNYGLTRSDEHKLKLKKLYKNKTWKIINGKRVWLNK